MPKNLNSYEDWKLLRQLGNGGFGEVLLWQNRLTGQEIATKRLKENPTLSGDERQKIKDRWLKEVDWMCTINTEHIVKAVKLDDEKDRNFLDYLNASHDWHPLPVIIMEYCNDGDVRDQLNRPEHTNGLPEFQVRDVLQALRYAIEFLHNKCCIVHRDLKPDNVVITKAPNGRRIYKLTDFGFARPAPEQTAKQSVVGTRHYFAPEIIDIARYKKNVDYWSLGIIAFELCCGTLPFIPHRSLYDILINIRKKPDSCISIIENIQEPDQFLFKNQLPPEQNLSKIFVDKMNNWLPLALDIDTKRRGTRLTMPNGMQYANVMPAIFTELDTLLSTRILTAFYMNAYKFLYFEVDETMTLKNFGELISRAAGIKEQHIFIVLPTGHPHQAIKSGTRPIDLYVSDWDQSVMCYIINMQGEYNAETPVGSETICHCLALEPKQLKNWQMQQFISHIHFLLSNEQLHLSSFLNGLKMYALEVEDSLIKHKDRVDQLLQLKWKGFGQMQQFRLMINCGIEAGYRKSDWRTKTEKFDEEFKAINKSVEGIHKRFESALRNSRAEAQNKLFDELIDSDIFKLKNFRKLLLSNTRPEKQQEQYEICKNAAYDCAKDRQKFLDNTSVKKSRETISSMHDIYNTIRNRIAEEQLKKFSLKLTEATAAFHKDLFAAHNHLPTKLMKLDESMLSLRLDGNAAAESGENSLDSIVSISTAELKNNTLEIALCMEMEIEQYLPATLKRVNSDAN